MKRFFYFLLLSVFLFCNQACYSAENRAVSIVYPAPKVQIKAASTFIIGSVDPRCKLQINNEDIMVYPSGSFVKVVPLEFGANHFTFTTILGEDKVVSKYTIHRSLAAKSLPKYPVKILKSTILPKTDLVYKAGDVVTVELQGATGHYAYFKVGKENIPMRELSITEAGKQGVYRGFYKILPGDKFDHSSVSVYLDDGKIKVSEKAKGTVTFIPADDNVLVRCLADKTIIRATPDGDRLPPLLKDTVLTINGSDGDFYRVSLTKDKNAWVSKKDVDLLSASVVPPQSDLSDLNVYSDKDNIYMSFPMEYKLPVIVEQQAPNKIRIDIYGSNNNFSMDEYKDEDIKSLKIIEPQDKKLSLMLEMKNKQMWGYDYYFKNDEFILRMPKKPVINTNCPLQDIVIAVDPGHGGDEKGAIGPTGVCEKDINLAICAYLGQELSDAGAKVLLTRASDVKTDLYFRPEAAKLNGAMLLLSIHSNALPDGLDPYTKHGTGTYYFQPQAKPLAEAIQASLLLDTGLVDDGVNKRSFVLTRSTIPVSVLVECAYMINPSEYEMLIDPVYQKKFAAAIKKGVENFLKNQTN